MEHARSSGGPAGDYRAAESSFQKAIDLLPGFAGAYINLGRLYQENVKKDPEALKRAYSSTNGC